MQQYFQIYSQYNSGYCIESEPTNHKGHTGLLDYNFQIFRGNFIAEPVM